MTVQDPYPLKTFAGQTASKVLKGRIFFWGWSAVWKARRQAVKTNKWRGSYAIRWGLQGGIWQERGLRRVAQKQGVSKLFLGTKAGGKVFPDGSWRAQLQDGEGSTLHVEDSLWPSLNHQCSCGQAGLRKADVSVWARLSAGCWLGSASCRICKVFLTPQRRRIK